MTEAYSGLEARRSEALRSHLEQYGSFAGSLHHVSSSNDCLILVAAVGLPDNLLPTIQTIPINKGLAGLAWARESTVASCNLQHDPNVGEQAKPLPFESTYAIPIFEDGVVTAILGIAFERTAELTEETLERIGTIPPVLSPQFIR